MTAALLREAEAVVNSPAVIRTFAACEWDELGEDGQAWIAAIVAEAQLRACATPAPPPPDKLAMMREWVSFETGVAVSRIVGTGRDAPAVRARDALVWGARIVAGLGAADVGRRLNRDHSTISVAFARAEDLRLSDPAFRRLTDRLFARFAVAS